ncbi:MAG: molybdopterin-binding protein [Gordonia sp. (in: high G+C Gram-positive bacteria)]|uniref:MogA/MoaB family molybdenum cofactor biosynthesis protein n=1 Tax=Gordonia sp. (in: high G+C Gram-positive bacteria) TaxID=84139 RepID=UPI0039E667C2
MTGIGTDLEDAFVDDIDDADVEAADAAARAAETDDDAVSRALVVVVDDQAAHGEDLTRIGPLVGELLEEGGYHVDATVAVSGDEVEIRNALNTAVIGGVDLVVSVGGVGVRARDVAPEATEPLLDRRLRGIEEALRSSGLSAGATDGGLSRGLAGVSGQTLVVNLANSRAAVRDGMATLIPLSHFIIDEIGEF